MSSTRPRAVHLTSAHPADDIRIFHKECCTLATAGYDISLVATRSSLPEGTQVKLVRVRPSSNRTQRMLFGTAGLLSAALRLGADLYHLHDPELIPVGFMLKTLGKRVIYDVHEDLPRQILSKSWIPRATRRLMASAAEAIECVASRVFDAIIAATPHIAKRFSGPKTLVLPNYPLLGEFTKSTNRTAWSTPPLIAYVGSITSIRGVQQMVDAMDLLPDRLEIRLALAGEFSPPSLEREIRGRRGAKHVDFMGRLDRSDVDSLLSRARAGLVVFHPEPNHINAQPNKIFEYMSAGLPVICSEFALWHDLIGRTNAGLLVNPLEPGEIADAIMKIILEPDMAEAMGSNGLRAINDRFNWEAESYKLVNLYDRLLMCQGTDENTARGTEPPK